MSQVSDPFRITSTHFVVPQDRQSSADISKLVNRDVEWIEQNVGVSNRHVCSPGDDPALLASLAAKGVIEKSGEPDLLIYASASIRQCIPDTSVFVAKYLGLRGIPSFSLNATCLSFLVALNNAAKLLDSNCRRILIVSAEFPTLSRNFEDPESAALFGDAAAAVMIEKCDRVDSGLVCFCQETWPEHAELAQVRGGGLLRHPLFESTSTEDYRFQMNGEALLRSVLPKLKRFLRKLFDDFGVKMEDLDLIVPHQPSAAGLKLLEHLGAPSEKTINVLSQYGNCVSASIPMALAVADRDGRLKAGDRVLILGTAAGLSIGAAILQW